MAVLYRGYKARRSLARQRPPGRADIARAIPRGSRRLRGRTMEKQLLAHLGADPRFLALRADARESVLLYARYLARTADYQTAVTRPTRTALCGYARRSESTWKAVRRRLEAWGYLGTVKAGCKYWLPHSDETRHDAAIYVITVPTAAAASQLTRPPTGTPKGACAGPRARGREKPRSGAAASGRAHSRTRRRDAHAAAATGAGAAHSAALRTGPGQRISDGWAGYLIAPFLAAGWTPADVAFAIDHAPDGRQHPYPVRDVRRPAAWLRWRLAHWLRPGTAGTWKTAEALPSVSQARAASNARLARAQAEWAAARAAAAAAASRNPAARAAAIRAAMGWPQPRKDPL